MNALLTNKKLQSWGIGAALAVLGIVASHHIPVTPVLSVGDTNALKAYEADDAQRAMQQAQEKAKQDDLLKAQADAKAKADAEQAQRDAKAKADADAAAKAKAEMEAQAQHAAEVTAQAEAATKPQPTDTPAYGALMRKTGVPGYDEPTPAKAPEVQPPQPVVQKPVATPAPAPVASKPVQSPRAAATPRGGGVSQQSQGVNAIYKRNTTFDPNGVNAKYGHKPTAEEQKANQDLDKFFGKVNGN